MRNTQTQTWGRALTREPESQSQSNKCPAPSPPAGDVKPASAILYKQAKLVNGTDVKSRPSLSDYQEPAKSLLHNSVREYEVRILSLFHSKSSIDCRPAG